jgi:hypothetical protein
MTAETRFWLLVVIVADIVAAAAVTAWVLGR